MTSTLLCFRAHRPVPSFTPMCLLQPIGWPQPVLYSSMSSSRTRFSLDLLSPFESLVHISCKSIRMACFPTLCMQYPSGQSSYPHWELQILLQILFLRKLRSGVCLCHGQCSCRTDEGVEESPFCNGSSALLSQKVDSGVGIGLLSTWILVLPLRLIKVRARHHVEPSPCSSQSPG